MKNTFAHTYIGLDRNRNFWHDGWVILALLAARHCVWPNVVNHEEEELRLLLKQLVDRYGHLSSNDEFDGTVWHWPKSLKSNDDNVRCCGDNILLYAITRSLEWAPGGLAEYHGTGSFARLAIAIGYRRTELNLKIYY